MTSTDASQDRIAPFITLWESYTGADCSTIAALFTLAAELLEREGYDCYSKTEDATVTGLTIREALERVSNDEARAEAARHGAQDNADMIERDTETLADDLERRLAGVLLVTGQHVYTDRGLSDVVWTWSRAIIWRGKHATYRGPQHVTRLLRAAAAMTLATTAGE
jgi:hypothetical protein